MGNSISKDLLSSSKNIVVNIDLAAIIGLNEAIVLRQIFYWIEFNEKQQQNYHDGKYWTFNSIKKWQEHSFPFWSTKTIERTFKSLRNKKILLVGNYNSDARDKSYWYTIDFEVLDEILDNAKSNTDKLSMRNSSDCPDAQRHGDNVQADNVGKALPYNTTYNTKNKYTTKNTDKASTVVEENYKAFFSEKEKKILELPSLPYEYSQEEFDRFIYVKIYNIILQSQGVSSEDLGKAGAITEVVSYFHKRYLRHTGERHPIMKDSVYESIVRKMLNPIDAIIELDAFMDVDSYKRMIDRFFSTEYGKKSGNITDYRIGYFFSDTVLERLCYRECQ